MGANSIWATLLGAACAVGLVACKSTHILLHVRAPGDADLSSSIVRLIDAGQPICGGGLLFFGRTDPRGRLRIATPACGDVQLIVTRQDRRSFVQQLDTCEVSSLDVTLKAARRPRGVPGSCDAVAGEFVAAWMAADHDHSRSFWLTPESYEPYARSAANERPWALDISEGAVDGRTCRVAVNESDETACDISWQIELERVDDRGWGVRGLRQYPR